jgi:hypothetical protein
MKEFLVMKGPLKVNNPITNKVDKFKMWAIYFCKTNVSIENKDPRV